MPNKPGWLFLPPQKFITENRVAAEWTPSWGPQYCEKGEAMKIQRPVRERGLGNWLEKQALECSCCQRKENTVTDEGWESLVVRH